MAVQDQMYALLARISNDPQALDRLAQSAIDPAVLSSQIPAQGTGLEELYNVSPQASQVPLSERTGLQPATGNPLAAALGAGNLAQQLRPKTAPLTPGPAPRFGHTQAAQIQAPFPVAQRQRVPSIGELLAGK
jgi:hypothetical protein